MTNKRLAPITLSLLIACCLVLASRIMSGKEDAAKGTPAEPTTTHEGSASRAQQLAKDDEGRTRSLALAFALAASGPSNEIPLPNFEGRPGVSPPIGVNFYMVFKDYPDYLLCKYDVWEEHYDRTNEPAWFIAALGQIRDLGPNRFPPERYIAIAIFNRAEHRDEKSYAQAYKVAAIFDVNGVFDPSVDIGELMGRTRMDRQPFVYDPQQSTPSQQQRWVIVERHAAATRAAGGAN
jgi:hypothetical protein